MVTDKMAANFPALVEAMGNIDADVLVASSPENVTYLSGYRETSHWARRGTEVYTVVDASNPTKIHLIAPASGADLLARSQVPMDRVHLYGDYPILDSGDVLLDDESTRYKELLAQRAGLSNTASELLLDVVSYILPRSAGKIALEQSSTPRLTEAKLQASLDKSQIVDAAAILREARAIKTEHEIAALRLSAQITEAAMLEVIAQARCGVTEMDIKRKLHRAIVDSYCEPAVTVVLAGVRSALPSANSTRKPVVEGEVLRIDGGCRSSNYISDIARTAVHNRPSVKMLREYSALWSGVDAAAEKLRPGITGGELFEIQARTVRKNGIPEYERLHCGHGIGISNYDLPRITPGSEDIIRPGMVICLETPFYKLGQYGLQVEDTFLVTESGSERFTFQSPELLTLP